MNTNRPADPALARVKGMVLAAGYGTRLLPLTRFVPKALLPIEGRTLLEWNLRYLASAGIREVVINACALADQVAALLERLSEERAPGLPALHCLREETILGSAGGIANAADRLDTEDVLVMNAKILFRPDLASALAFHRSGGFLATLLCAPDPLHAQIRIREGRAEEIAARSLPDDPAMRAFTGVYFLSREAVRRLRRAAEDDGRVVRREIVPDFRAWIEQGKVGAIAVEDRPFRAIETPESYLEALRDAAGPLRGALLGEEAKSVRLEADAGEAGASEAEAGDTESFGLSGADESFGLNGADGSFGEGEARGNFGFVEEGAAVDPGARVRDSAVFRGAVLGPQAVVERAIVGPGARVEAPLACAILAGGEARPLFLLPAEEEAELTRLLTRIRSGAGVPRLRLLHGDGSSRRIVRVLFEDRSRILMRFPPAGAANQAVYPRRPSGEVPTECGSFVYVAAYLERLGVRVPKLFAIGKDPAGGSFVLQEDLGDTLLFSWLPGPAGAEAAWSSGITDLYKEAITILARMQRTWGFDPDRTHNPPYDAGFILEYEAGYFHREMVRGFCSLDLSWDELRPACLAAAEEALSGPPVFMHRDYQSRNLMLAARGLAVIDFQGARLGPAEYDVASLLFDPYAAVPAAVRRELFHFYLGESGGTRAGGKTLEALRRYQACGINRLLQALGAYAYLGGRLGKPGFLPHARAALTSLADLASGTDQDRGLPRYPAIAEAALRTLEAFEKKLPPTREGA